MQFCETIKKEKIRSKAATLLELMCDYLEYGFIVPKKHYFSRDYIRQITDCSVVYEFLDRYEFQDECRRSAEASILFFMYFIIMNNSDLDVLDYETVYRFCVMRKKHNGGASSYAAEIRNVKKYLEYCGERDIVIKQISMIMTFSGRRYYQILRESVSDAEISALAGYRSEADIEAACSAEAVERLMGLFVENGYRAEIYTEQVRTVIFRFKIFTDVYHLPFCYETIYFWANNIISKVMREKNSYFSIVIRMMELVTTGSVDFTRNRFQKNNHSYDGLPQWALDYTNEYIAYRKKLGSSASTLFMDKASITRLVNFAESRGIRCFDDMNESFLMEFRHYDQHKTAEGKNAYLSRIRMFLKFMSIHHGLRPIHESIFLQTARTSARPVLILDPEFIEAMKKYPEKADTITAVRDYAIYLLALRTGLRIIDILQLRFSDVSFIDMSITTMQEKSNREILTHMPVEAANALYKYVKFARPKSISEYIFLSVKPPYLPLKGAVSHNAMERFSLHTGVDVECPKGLHSARRTFATSALSNGHERDKVARVLGHADNENVNKYLSLDDRKMKMCTLDHSDIGMGCLENEED